MLACDRRTEGGHMSEERKDIKKKKKGKGRKQYSDSTNSFMVMKSEENSIIHEVSGKDLSMKAKGKPRTLNSQDSKNVAYYTEFAHDLLEKRSLASLTIQ